LSQPSAFSFNKIGGWGEHSGTTATSRKIFGPQGLLSGSNRLPYGEFREPQRLFSVAVFAKVALGAEDLENS
jgi:hypothetical protein